MLFIARRPFSDVSRPWREARSIREDDDAVSPVVGVILMVAITVVLAAIVVVLIAKLNHQPDGNPLVSFNVDDRARLATVNKASGEDLVWGDAANPGLVATCSVGTAVTKDVTGVVVVPGGTPVTTGDTVSGCSGGATLTVADTVSNTMLYTHVFP